jgi:nucleotide-binding universal stress UspA family protein
MNLIKHILVPTDCSDLSRKAVEYAITLAKSLNAKITLFTVSNETVRMCVSEYSYVPEEIFQRVLKDHAKSQEKQLSNFWSQFDHMGVEVNLVRWDGDPFHQIICFAKNSDVDIIVMGTHGRTGIQHILMGSVAEKVIRYSPFPVLTVKDKDHPYKPLTHD